MILFPNAKINLGLRILRRRQDGYHDLETIFYPISWCDILEIMPLRDDKKIWLTSSGLSLPGSARDNLVYKTASLMQERYSLPGVRIHLHKQIPAGAGLGGGSSDATFTLKALNQVYSLNLPKDEIESMALTLGSDCPFFLNNKPALAIGRGERLTLLDLSLKENYILIIYPGLEVNTGKMFRSTRPSEEGLSLIQAVALPPSEWEKHIINHFEKTLAGEFPVIPELLKFLHNHGAWYASVSGSGSSVYGLFTSPPPQIKLPEEYITWIGQL